MASQLTSEWVIWPQSQNRAIPTSFASLTAGVADVLMFCEGRFKCVDKKKGHRHCALNNTILL